MDTIRTMYLKTVEKFRHIFPPWTICRTLGKATQQRSFLMFSAELRHQNLESDRPFHPASTVNGEGSLKQPQDETDL
jgi:hypothetical protein